MISAETEPLNNRSNHKLYCRSYSLKAPKILALLRPERNGCTLEQISHNFIMVFTLILQSNLNIISYIITHLQRHLAEKTPVGIGGAGNILNNDLCLRLNPQARSCPSVYIRHRSDVTGQGKLTRGVVGIPVVGDALVVEDASEEDAMLLFFPHCLVAWWLGILLLISIE